MGQTSDLKPLPPPKKSYSSLQKLIDPSAWASLPCLPAPQCLGSSQSIDVLSAEDKDGCKFFENVTSMLLLLETRWVL